MQFRRYDGMDQDDDGIWAAPGGARVAWFADPDGHVLSLIQEPGPRPGTGTRQATWIPSAGTGAALVVAGMPGSP